MFSKRNLLFSHRILPQIFPHESEESEAALVKAEVRTKWLAWDCSVPSNSSSSPPGSLHQFPEPEERGQPLMGPGRGRGSDEGEGHLKEMN